MRILGISLLAALLVFVFPAPLRAQISLDQAGDATLSFSPEYPRPGDTITVKLRSFAADIASADILWEVDGEAVNDGMGLDTITVTAPKAGETMSIRATALSGGRRFVAETSFTPAGVALLWEGVGYTPPFYKGKTLLAYGGVTRVVALPDFRSASGARVSAGELIYTWEKNGRKVLAVSGVGKSTADFLQDSYLRGEDTLTVEVRDPATNALAKSSVTIAPQRNQVNIYQESPTLGRLYNRIFSGSNKLSQGEISLIAEPYFMTAPSRDAVSYSWKQNGLLTKGTSKSRITISNPLSGSASYSVTASSDRMLQGGTASFSMIFEALQDDSSASNPFTQ